MKTERIMRLSLSEKLELEPNKVFENIQGALQKALPLRKVKVYSTLDSAEFGSSKNIYAYVVTVVVDK